MKLKTILKAAKILRSIGNAFAKIKTLFPKSQKVDKDTELVKEIRALREDLKKRDDRIRDIVSDELDKRSKTTGSKKDQLKDEAKQPESEDWVQAELYTTAVESGTNDSYGDGYILVNLPRNEWDEIKNQINKMPTATKKQHVGFEKKMVVRAVSKGETFTSEKQRFVEINGQREEMKNLKEIVGRL